MHDTPHLYPYVGPEAIREAVAAMPPGQLITSSHHLNDWIRRHHAQARDEVTVTFVIDAAGRLRLADRHSEHVACAASAPVRSAGEMTFTHEQQGWQVSDVSNQSTGYCPEPTSWHEVERALDLAQIAHPGRFTRAFDFRRCEACGELALVRDAWWECMACGAPLPAMYNVTSKSPFTEPT